MTPCQLLLEAAQIIEVRGLAKGICEALKTVQRETRARATSTALAVVDKRTDAACVAMALAFPKTVKRAMGGSRLDGNAYAQGQAAGRGIGQRTALGNAGGKRLLCS